MEAPVTENPTGADLRPLALGDIERVLHWRNLPEVAAYMHTDHAISETEHVRWFADAMTDESGKYWIIQSDGAPVGLVNLYDISPRHGRAYWAIYVAVPGVRGRGLGSAAERFVLRYAFETLGLETLCCEVLATNQRGVKMHERFGFRIDGVLRQHVRKGGDRVDVVTMSLLREEWMSGRWSTDG